MNKRLQASISINRIKEANEICSISKLNVWLFVAICNAETKPSLPWLRFRSLAPLTLTLLSQGGCVCSLLSFVCVPLISPWKKQGRLIFTNGGPSFPSELVQNQKKNEQNPTFQLETFESVFTFQFPVSLSIIGLAKFYCCPIPRNRNLGNLKKTTKDWVRQTLGYPKAKGHLLSSRNNRFEIARLYITLLWSNTRAFLIEIIEAWPCRDPTDWVRNDGRGP